jgi:hypothetical protein
MLDPDARSLYTAAVTPPPGYIFDQALATTYSLDPETLLSLPVHMALAERSSSRDVDPIKFLESLRRISEKFTVFVDHTGIKPPSKHGDLFGLLESMLVQVKAPKGGVFHPKIWVLRFIQPGADTAPLIRLLILSRNITFDRSWDVSLQLDGNPGEKLISANRELAGLIRELPSMGITPLDEGKQAMADLIAREILNTVWEIPEGYESVAFHVPGSNNHPWVPAKTKRMAIISPFVTVEALRQLKKQTERLMAVVSRPDELNQLPPDSEILSEKWFTLHEAAESEDGEELESRDTHGLHAKVFITEKGGWTNLFIGSANATSAALVLCSNVEIIAELVGRTNQVGTIERFLSKDGLGALLSEYERPDEFSPEEDEERQARKALEKAGKVLAGSELKITCLPEGDSWGMELFAPRPLVLEGVSSLRAWPITIPGERAIEISPQSGPGSFRLGRYAIESVTGLIAFELTGEKKGFSFRMVLNLPLEGISEENRNDAIFRSVLNNKEGFLKYLLLLLEEQAGNLFGTDGNPFGKKGDRFWSAGLLGEAPILEEMTRCFSRNPEKLEDIKNVIDRLMRNKKEESIIPEEFLALWKVFEKAMKESGL